MSADPVEAFLGLRFAQSTRVACPYCSNERRKSNSKDMTLSRKDDGAVVYYCHHCSTTGSVQPKERKLSAVPNPTIIASNKLQTQHYQWLKSRGISAETADKMKLFASERFFDKIQKMSDSVGFPYFREGALVAAKYRCINEKAFTQDSGGAHDFFGLDLVEKGKPLVIVEGEIDCLTLMEAGILNAVSVPSGAPIKVVDGKVAPSEDKRFSYVWNARDIIDAAPYVILATDQDGPGQALAEELARRIGKDKCRLAKFTRKDMNDVWLDDSTLDDPTQVIQEILDNATPYPIAGLSTASDFKDRLNDLYNKGTGSGFSTGYESIDQIYTVAPGQLTVVTGYPSSGKSNWVDQITVNLARSCDWKFAIASFENQPEVHIARLCEIYLNKRFYEGTDRMTDEEKDQAFKFVNEHFMFLDANGDEPNTLDSIIDRAKVAVKRMGIRGLVVDPYNYIELDRSTLSETDAISKMLTKVQKFNKAYDVHTWFVAHPAKVTRSGMEQPRPDGMSIAGSMAWFAKTDCGVTIHRHGSSPEVEVSVWKCRYRWVGTQGETKLLYNRTAGTYSDLADGEFL